MTTIEKSFGVIACANGITGKEILLVQQQDEEGNPTHWSFPKGHPEEGETPVETALRELEEETGIDVSSDMINEDSYFDYSYMFMGQDGFVEKHNRLFLVSVKFVADVSSHAPDVYRARFVNVRTARDLMPFSAAQTLLDEVEKWIISLG